MKQMVTEKHAFLLQVRSIDQRTLRLMQKLDNSACDLYLHVDAKSGPFDQAAVQQSLKRSAVFFTPRDSVSWAAFSQLWAEIELLRTAAQNEHYAYYHLLSESDYPVRPISEILSFFSGKKQEYVEFENINAPNSINRLRYYYPLQEYLGKKHGLAWAAQKVLLLFEHIFGVNRLQKNNKIRDIGKGPNWFSITDDLVRYVLSNTSEIEDTYKYCRAPDEVFLQTLILNSEYQAKLSNPSEGNVRYVLWKGGNSPVNLGPDNLPDIRQSGKLFARKVGDDQKGWALRSMLDQPRQEESL